jgi:hypothetical protein
LEYINDQNFEDIEVWDASWIGEKGFKNIAKMLLGGNKLQRSCKLWLKSKGIPVRKLYFHYLPKWKVKSSFKLLAVDTKLIDPTRHSLIFNTLVEKTGTLRVDLKTFKHPIMRELNSSLTLQSRLASMEVENHTQIITVN